MNVITKVGDWEECESDDGSQLIYINESSNEAVFILPSGAVRVTGATLAGVIAEVLAVVE